MHAESHRRVAPTIREFLFVVRSSPGKNIAIQNMVFTTTEQDSFIRELAHGGWIRSDDTRTLAVDLKRPEEDDRMQIEASHVVTSTVRCNTSLQFLGTEEQARSAGFYAVKYCGKDPVKINIILPVLYVMDKERESKAPDAHTVGRQAQHWLNRLLNNFGSVCEFSDTQVASALMGLDSYHTSHIFWTFHGPSFVKYQREKFGKGEMEPVAPDITDNGIHHFLPTDGTLDDGDRDQGEMLHVTDDKKVQVAAQHEHYIRRGEELEDLSPYEWAALIRIEKIPKGDEKISSTRQCNARFDFEDDGSTQWHKTHRQVLRTKFVVLHGDAFQSFPTSVGVGQPERAMSVQSSS